MRREEQKSWLGKQKALILLLKVKLLVEFRTFLDELLHDGAETIR
jgi:hypothetical protein